MAADTLTTESGLEALKISVDGLESDIPFQWIYYHIGNDDGRRTTFVFTLEKDAVDYFKNADQVLVQSVNFKAPIASTAKAVTPKTTVNRKYK